MVVAAMVMSLVMAGGFLAWIRNAPEPMYEGVGLGRYVRDYWKDRELRRNSRAAVKTMGPEAVPYLMKHIQGDPFTDLLIKISPSMPAPIASMFPDARAYRERIYSAAILLPEAGTNALTALPWLLKKTEAQNPNFNHNFVRAIGMLAPGTDSEKRATKLMLEVVRNLEPTNRETRRMAYNYLGELGGEEVVQVLLEGLGDYRVRSSCIEALVRIGTNAAPALKKIAEKEEGHIRPATSALERIEAARVLKNEHSASVREGPPMPLL